MDQTSHPEAERSILGAILLRPALLAACLHSGLTAEHFSITANGTIYTALVRMADDGKPIDSILLLEEVDADDVGGYGYVADLTTGAICLESHVLERCRLLRRKAGLRQIIRIAEEMEAAARERGADPERIITEAVEKLTTTVTAAVPA